MQSERFCLMTVFSSKSQQILTLFLSVCFSFNFVIALFYGSIHSSFTFINSLHLSMFDCGCLMNFYFDHALQFITPLFAKFGYSTFMFSRWCVHLEKMVSKDVVPVVL